MAKEYAMAQVRRCGVMAMLLVTVLCAHTAATKSRKDVPLAPLPAKVLSARKVFLVNGGGNDLAYDALYSAVKEWAQYEIVDSSSKADIIIEIRYVTEDHGTRVWSTTNASNGATDVHSRRIVDPQLQLTIFDPASKEALWSTVEHRRLARLGKNREKETINAAQRLVDNLKARVGTK
jgi:hypothetical protein